MSDSGADDPTPDSRTGEVAADSLAGNAHGDPALSPSSIHSSHPEADSNLNSAEEPTESLPLFPLGTVLVPDMRLSLHVFEPRYRQLVADLLSNPKSAAPEFGVVALKQGLEVGAIGDLFEVGTAALISDVVPMPDGRCNLAAVGRRRFAIRSVDTTSRPYIQAQVVFLRESDGDVRSGAAAKVRKLALRHIALLGAIGVQMGEDDEPLPVDARSLGYAIARQPGLTLVDRQAILAAENTAARLATATTILKREYELVRHLHAVPVSAASFRSAGSDQG